ncbi:MAG: PEP-CTERM sorting domain-containing protein [Planctomycetes bacterium]|nr:PEP-CTERM sorting domain-containing protein [Planctomycetota bacterium]
MPIDTVLIVTDDMGANVFELTYTGTITATASLSSDGDFDSDGDTDGADFLLWQQGFPGTYTASDLADWEANFGSPSPAVVANVPEPASLALAGFGIAAACLVRRRRQQ